MAKHCEMCGNYSGRYPLCRDCYEKYLLDEIEQCDECGAWHKSDEPCKCHDSKNANGTALPSWDEIEEDGFYCIICGEDSGDFCFCRDCYGKYKNKELLLKITDCKDVELLASWYQGRYVCDDGHVVKSKSEQIIDDYLFDHNIKHGYELPLDVSEVSELDFIHPDFCLFLKDGQKIYWEHWGYGEEDPSYMQNKKFKLDCYKKLGMTIISTDEESDGRNLKAVVAKKIKNIMSIKLEEF